MMKTVALADGNIITAMAMVIANEKGKGWPQDNHILVTALHPLVVLYPFHSVSSLSANKGNGSPEF